MARDPGNAVRVARFGEDGAENEAAEDTALGTPAQQGPSAPVARFDALGAQAAARHRSADLGPAEADGARASAPVAALGELCAAPPSEPVAELGPIAEQAAAPRRTAAWDGPVVGGRAAASRSRSAAVGEPRTGRRRASQAPGESQAPKERPRRRRPVVAEEPDTAGAGSGPPGDDTERTSDGAGRGPRERRGGPRRIDPDADPVSAAREICLRLLSDRSRTRQELAQALSRRGVPDEAAASVLERFDEVGLIDDAAFADQWVRSRHNHRGLARRAIAMELRRKGVDDEVASQALAEVDADSETRRARELVDRKLRVLAVDTPEQRLVATRRLVGMLARKGYGGGTAYGVVREALAAHGAEEDELGVEPVEE